MCIQVEVREQPAGIGSFLPLYGPGIHILSPSTLTSEAIFKMEEHIPQAHCEQTAWIEILVSV